MFRLVRHADINRPQWDALITEAPNGLIYALTWYLDSVSPGWEALIKEEGGRYVAVLPLPVRTKLGLRYLSQPPLGAQQLGLFYVEPPSAADWGQFGALLRQHFGYIARYAFNVDNAAVAGPAALGLPGALARTYHLSLRVTYTELWANYRPERRRHLRKAQVHNLVVEPATDINRLIQLFAENTAPRIVGVLGEAYEYPMLRALYAAASHRGLASLWQVRTPDHRLLGMMLLLHFKQQVIYIFNASTAEGKAVGAVSVMIDAFLQQHAGRDLYFDFESPGVPSLERFYGSFGSVEAAYFTVASNQLPWPVRQLKAARMALYQQFRPRPASGNTPG